MLIGAGVYGFLCVFRRVARVLSGAPRAPALRKAETVPRADRNNHVLFRAAMALDALGMPREQEPLLPAAAAPGRRPALLTAATGSARAAAGRAGCRRRRAPARRRGDPARACRGRAADARTPHRRATRIFGSSRSTT